MSQDIGDSRTYAPGGFDSRPPPPQRLTFGNAVAPRFVARRWRQRALVLREQLYAPRPYLTPLPDRVIRSLGLALNGHQARRWEPKRLRLRLFTLPATIARTGRQVRLHLATKAPWVDLVNHGVRQLRALAVPG